MSRDNPCGGVAYKDAASTQPAVPLRCGEPMGMVWYGMDVWLRYGWTMFKLETNK